MFKKLIFALAVASLAVSGTTSLFAADENAGQDPALASKIRAVQDVLRDFSNPPQAISPEVLQNARAVIVFSNMIRAGFLFSGNFGSGVALYRDMDGKWSQPAFFRISGGGFGLQAGGDVSDVLVIVNTPEALEGLLQDHFTFGVDFSATAGTVGGGVDASGNVSAAVVSYARTQGLFAGISLEGAVIKEDVAANNRYYGQTLAARDILLKNAAPATAAGDELIASLDSSLLKKN